MNHYAVLIEADHPAAAAIVSDMAREAAQRLPWTGDEGRYRVKLRAVDIDGGLLDEYDLDERAVVPHRTVQEAWSILDSFRAAADGPSGDAEHTTAGEVADVLEGLLDRISRAYYANDLTDPDSSSGADDAEQFYLLLTDLGYDVP